MVKAKSENSAKLFFYYVIVWFSLWFVAYGAGDILIFHINKFFEALAFHEIEIFSLKRSLSLMFVGIPALFIMLHLIGRGLDQGLYQGDNLVRRWITYIILGVAAAVALIDLAFAFNSYLSGEYAVKQYLILLAILAVATSVIAYFLFDINRPIPTSKAKMRLVTYPLAIVILGIFVSGMMQIPSPHTARLKKMDDLRLSSMVDLSNKIVDYYNKRKLLPVSLAVLVSEKLVYSKNIKDKETSEPFEYRILDPTHFEICAHFHQEGRHWSGPEWEHGAGRQCFKQEVRSSSTVEEVIHPPIFD